MKQEIYEELRAKMIGDDLWMMRDFELIFDSENRERNEAFFVTFTPSSVKAVGVGFQTVKSYAESEYGRMLWFRDFYEPLACGLETCGCTSSQTYYYDGISLRNVTEEQAKEIFIALYHEYYQELATQYPKEAEYAFKPQKIRFTGDTEKNVMETMHFAFELQDKSFGECMRRLSNYQRYAIEEEIIISNDFTPHSYYIQHIRNGEMVFNGAIIFDPDNKSGKHWTIHT